MGLGTPGKNVISIPIKRVYAGTWPIRRPVDLSDGLCDHYCYGYYCQRKKLSLFCMFKCAWNKDCKKSRRTFNRGMIWMIFSFIINMGSFILARLYADGLPAIAIVSGGCCVFIAGLFFYELFRMIWDTNRMLKDIDKLPVIQEGKP